MSRASEIRSSGKIVRQRRLASSSRTPYDRPPPPSVHNSNWLSTAGRVLVTGAGKLLSTVMASDTSSSSSTDDEVDSGDLQTELPQHIIFTSESKQKIEELILEETFSRDECDALIQLIRSRTIDDLMLEDMQDTHMNNHRDTAVMEARKWIEERKNETVSKSNLEHGSGSLSSPWAPQIATDAGSPIDVARTYMQVHPPWAPPTANLSEIRGSTNVKVHTLTDGLSFPRFGVDLSSQTKKRDSLASGSWSIAEEMRKVRSRATDELLSTPSRKYEFSINRDADSDTIKNGHKENLAGSSSFTLALAAVADKCGDPVAKLPTSTRSTALETTGDGPHQGPLSSKQLGQTAATSNFERIEGVATLEEANGQKGDISASANDFQSVPSMTEELTIEQNTDTTGHDGIHGNISNEEIPHHEFPYKQESELDAITSSSKQTPDEEPTLDASKSRPEVFLAVEATKKQQRAKQPVRVARGKGRGIFLMTKFLYFRRKNKTKKRDSLASGSWSIAEEMRKVRARATDELLSTLSRKYEFSINRDADSDTIKNGHKENLAASSSFTLALAAVADKCGDPVAKLPTSTRSTALETTGDGPHQGPLSSKQLGQTAATSNCERIEGVATLEEANGQKGDISASDNDVQSVPSMTEELTIEQNTDTTGHDGIHGNISNEEIPHHEFPYKQESELDAITSSSKQTPDEEPTLDASKSRPEVFLAVEATKKQQRVKQPVRVARGKGRGIFLMTKFLYFRRKNKVYSSRSSS